MTKYFIAWHPELGYHEHYMSIDREFVESKMPTSCEIRTVHLIDDAKVREMWEKINNLKPNLNAPPGNLHWDTWWVLTRHLQSILPEPKD